MADSWKPPVAQLTQWVQKATTKALLTNDTAHDASPYASAGNTTSWSYQHVRGQSPSEHDSRAALLEDDDNGNKSGTESPRESIDDDPMAADGFEWSEEEEKALVRKYGRSHVFFLHGCCVCVINMRGYHD
jgi:hypothetical protein